MDHNVDLLVAQLLDRAAGQTPTEFLARGRKGQDGPGLYSWWVDTAGAAELTTGLAHPVEEGLIYAGAAGATRWPSGQASTNTLWGRVARMHLGRTRTSRRSGRPSPRSWRTLADGRRSARMLSPPGCGPIWWWSQFRTRTPTLWASWRGGFWWRSTHHSTFRGRTRRRCEQDCRNCDAPRPGPRRSAACRAMPLRRRTPPTSRQSPGSSAHQLRNRQQASFAGDHRRVELRDPGVVTWLVTRIGAYRRCSTARPIADPGTLLLVEALASAHGQHAR